MPPLRPLKGNLTALHLSSNYLKAIPADYFCGFIRLSSTYLDYNKLLAVPNITPLKATLAHLELGRNPITSFEPFLTNTIFPILRFLIAYNNRITYLTRDMIRYWPKLINSNLRNSLLKNFENLSLMIHEAPLSLTVRLNSYPSREHIVSDVLHTMSYPCMNIYNMQLECVVFL